MDDEPQRDSALSDARYIGLNLSVRERLSHLKGARLSTFMALALHEAELCRDDAMALSIREIAEQTGFSRRQVARAVRFLVEQHWVTQLPRLGRRGRLYRLAECDLDVYPALHMTPMSACASEVSGTGTPMSALSPNSSGTMTPMSVPAPDLPGTRTPMSASAPVVVVSSTSLDSKLETTTEVHARVRAILSNAGIWGKDLNRLAATVAPELAKRWAIWIRWANQEATDRFPSPAGLARFCLLRDPTQEPDSICRIPEGYDPWGAPINPPVEPPVPEPDDAGFAATERDAGGELNAQKVWHATVEELRLAMPNAAFEAWVKPTVGVGWEGDVLVVRVHSPYAKEWLERRLQTTVQRALTGILERPVEIRYETG